MHLIQTCWRGQGRAQGVADAAQLLVYWGLMLVFVDLRFGWLVVLGATLCIGNRLWKERSPKALLVGSLFAGLHEVPQVVGVGDWQSLVAGAAAAAMTTSAFYSAMPVALVGAQTS